MPEVKGGALSSYVTSGGYTDLSDLDAICKVCFKAAMKTLHVNIYVGLIMVHIGTDSNVTSSCMPLTAMPVAHDTASMKQWPWAGISTSRKPCCSKCCSSTVSLWKSLDCLKVRRDSMAAQSLQESKQILCLKM